MQTLENLNLGYISYSLLLIWLFYSIYYIAKAQKYPEQINYYLFESIPSVFVSLGLLGTFMGLTQGLLKFDTDPALIKQSIKDLLGGLKYAFIVSLAGLSLSIVFSKITNYYLFKLDDIQPPKSPELKQMELINKNIEGLGEIIEQTSKQQNRKFTELVSEISVVSNSISTNLDAFASSLASTNSGAIVEAMQSVMYDFNDTIQEFIQSLVDKNFNELTTTVKNLNQWQQQHKEQVIQLTDTYQSLVSDTSTLVRNTESIIDINDKLIGRNGRIQEILVSLGKVIVEDKKFVELIGNLTNTINKMSNLSNSIEQTSISIKNIAENNIELTNTITDWFAKEYGIKESIILLNSQLKEIKSIKQTDFGNMDRSFVDRLGKTFGSLDDVLTKYIKSLEKLIKDSTEKINKNG